MQNWNTENQQGRSVDLRRVLQALWRHVWILTAVAIVCGLVAFIYFSAVTEPTYRTSFTAYISNRGTVSDGDSTTTSDLNASRGLMYVYREVITSRTVLMEAASQSGLEGVSYASVANMVSTYGSEDAAVMTVYVETQDPILCKRLADAISEIGPQQVAKVVAGSTMTLIDPPYKPTVPFTPDVAANTLLFAAVGLALAAAVVIVLELGFDSVSGNSELEDRYQIQVIGRIPDITLAEKSEEKYSEPKGRGERR